MKYDEMPKTLGWFNSSIVILVGGNDNTKSAELLVRKEVAEKSKWLRKAFEEQWLEGRTGKLELPDDDLEVVQSYLHFLYFGELPSHGCLELDVDTLAKLYVFGDKICHFRFKNAILEALRDSINADNWEDANVYISNLHGSSTVNIIYEGTLPGSIGRKLLAELHYYCKGDSNLADVDITAENYHPEFLEDLQTIGARKRDQRDAYDVCFREKYQESQKDGDEVSIAAQEGPGRMILF